MRKWVYYMQQGLKSMWSKEPKKNKKYKIDLNDRTREEKIEKEFDELRKESPRGWWENEKKEFEPIDFKDCGCLPDCGCKEWVVGFKY